MSGGPKAQALGRHVSHVVGLDGSAAASPEYEPGEPLDPHESHDLVLYDRWAECAHCRARDHWPAIAIKCQGKGAADVRSAPVTISDAVDKMISDLEAFRAWWIARAADLGLARPTYSEIVAEFASWSAYRGGPR